MNFEYIIALALLLLAYGAVLWLMKYFKNRALTNLIFTLFVFIPYLFNAAIVYESVGFYDWNFQNVLPVANVSPFMFCLVPLMLIVPRRAQRYLYLLVSLLSVGMLLSSVFGCIYNASINYRFHFNFLLDYIAHMALSLFGVYLVRSGQVKLSLRNALVSGSVIISVATLMLLLNVVFDTSFFGLSLNGKHSIYNSVLVDNSYLSALLYYIGLSAVLIMGYGYSYLWSHDRFKIGALAMDSHECHISSNDPTRAR